MSLESNWMLQNIPIIGDFLHQRTNSNLQIFKWTGRDSYFRKATQEFYQIYRLNWGPTDALFPRNSDFPTEAAYITPFHGLIGVYQVTAFFVMIGKISMLHNFEILNSCIVFQDSDNKFTHDFDFHGGQTWELRSAIFSTSEIQALEKASLWNMFVVGHILGSEGDIVYFTYWCVITVQG